MFFNLHLIGLVELQPELLLSLDVFLGSSMFFRDRFTKKTLDKQDQLLV